MLLEGSLFLLTLTRRHKNALFEEVRGRDHSISIELAIIFDLLDSHKVVLGVYIGTNVGIARALVNQMTDFLTAEATDVLDLLSVGSTFFIHLLVFLLRLVLRVLATWLVFVIFSTAPPNFT